MSANTLRATVAFSFQGQTHEISLCVDLDAYLQQNPGHRDPNPEAPDWHRLLAQAADIDPYSYLYEVLESHEVELDAPTGLAAPCLQDGRFDWPRFVHTIQEQTRHTLFERIARETLQAASLDAIPGLATALAAAYAAGQAADRQ